mmetsp:Transcript_3580/g.7693  ORF Transcript_3580/g.7693 Transcript_3580/m.7693 type:complete len:1191 (-) Transcript_3580:28-3600(-)
MTDAPLLPRNSDFVQISERNIRMPADGKQRFCDNKIATSKYNCITFLPKNTLEQFQKLANVYFLIVAVLQSIPQISVTDGIPNILLPLFFVMGVSAIKDLLEDNKRKRSDAEENTRLALKRANRSWVPETWRNLKVGDIVKIEKDQFFSADMILLSSSEPKGICYIETKNLDGETNMKHKLSHKDTHSFMSIESNLDDLQYAVNCEGPNSRIYTFNGVLSFQSQMVPLTNEQFLLRGCSLKNTAWIIGLVVYTGHETKIMLNSGRSKPKYSSIENQMNKQIIFVFMLQVGICVVAAILSGYWYGLNIKHTQEYLDLESLDQPIYILMIYQFLSWMLIFSNFVPISLIVSLEMVKFLQALSITKDPDIYYEPLKMPAKVQSSNLNEELGQISYVFSDKTGTLTCNVMEFRKCSIDGQNFGTNRRMPADEKLPYVDFVDASIDKTDPKLVDFFTHLATCHTVVAEEVDGEIEYKASSPDELSLVNAAAYFGIRFMGRDKENNLEVDSNGETCIIRMLNVIEFNSVRKRMSVIVEMPDGTIKLLCKGADTVIQPRLVQSKIIKPTWQHLEDFAEEGLRTLVIATRNLEPDDYLKWNQQYYDAMNDIHDRDRRIDALADQIEQNLNLIGATAIEDRLQDYVPETIAKLQSAGIKVWVLTGDKIETAINIGYSCNLLANDMVQLLVQGHRSQEVKEEIVAAQQTVKVAKTGKRFALIVSGDALLKALQPELAKELMIVADQCIAVLCCRVSPQQKAQVVQMVRKALPTVRTLGIGDGANDVNMICAAHVGIGISGLEGQQAVRASDFAVAQFWYLRRLLFVHGREAYRKNSTLVCYNFYKNILLTMPLFWYGFMSVFSGQLFYNNWTFQFFNLVYAAFPILIYALFDEEKPASLLMIEPTFYQIGLNHRHFNPKVFWGWILEAFLHSFCIVGAVMFGLNLVSVDATHGRMISLAGSGIVVFGTIVLFANVKILLISYVHYWFSILFMILSVGSYYASEYTITHILPIKTWLDNFENRGYTIIIVKNPAFYLITVLLIVGCHLVQPLLREFRYYFRLKNKPPTVPYQIMVDEASSSSSEEEEDQREATPKRKRFSINVPFIARKHTGFAFSGEAGHDLQVTDPQFFTYNTRESNALSMRRSETLKLRSIQEDSESDEDVDDSMPLQKSNTTVQRRYSMPFLLSKLQSNLKVPDRDS